MCRYRTILIGTLLADFARYLQLHAPIDVIADGVSYRETPFYLSDEEFAQAAAAVNQAMRPFLANPPAPHRRRRLFATVVFPDPELPDAPHGPKPVNRPANETTNETSGERK